MSKAKASRQGFVEQQWKPLLDGVESSRLRRGKALAKQNEVSHVRIANGVIHGEVKNQRLRNTSFSVQFPTVDGWTVYQEKIATWLTHRQDWFASLLAGNWNMEWIDFVSEAGLRLFPNQSAAEKMLSEATCNCSDWEAPCQHVAAVAYYVIWDSETHPLRAMSYVGIETDGLLDAVQQQSAVSMGARNKTKTTTLNASLGISLWSEEQKIYHPQRDEDIDITFLRHRIAPMFDDEKFKQWKKNYMAWK